MHANIILITFEIVPPIHNQNTNTIIAELHYLILIIYEPLQKIAHEKDYFYSDLLFATNNIIAQTNYYTETKTFYEEGYTYQADNYDSGRIKVYNKDCIWINTTQTYKETGEHFDMLDYEPELIERQSLDKTIKILHSILEECYTEDEKINIKNNKKTSIINLFINTETGKVDDVRFSFDNTSYYIYIPVSTFRKIELQIKDKLSFTVTEEGKKLNYIYYWEDYQFK